MDMANNHDTAPVGHVPGAESAGRTPDWDELRLRLDAACATRRALAESDSVPAGDASFDLSVVRLLSAYPAGLADVNRTDLANGKPIGGNDPAIASSHNSGDRG